MNGAELWRTDGTEAGTVPVADIVTGSAGSRPRNFRLINDVLYFTVEVGHDTALWKTDGTTAGTVPVKALESGFVSALGQVHEANFFTTRDTNGGVQLWNSNGTESGTALVLSSGSLGTATLTATTCPIGGKASYSRGTRTPTMTRTVMV